MLIAAAIAFFACLVWGAIHVATQDDEEDDFGWPG